MTIKGKFDVDVYACSVHIVVSDYLKVAINARLKAFSDESGEDYGRIDFEPCGYCLRRNDRIGNYYVFLHKDHFDFNTFNHEKAHVVEWILKDRNIGNRGEVVAYLDGYVSQMFHKFFKKKKLKLIDP